jgi:hypothetical protein
MNDRRSIIVPSHEPTWTSPVDEGVDAPSEVPHRRNVRGSLVDVTCERSVDALVDVTCERSVDALVDVEPASGSSPPPGFEPRTCGRSVDALVDVTCERSVDAPVDVEVVPRIRFNPAVEPPARPQWRRDRRS